MIPAPAARSVKKPFKIGTSIIKAPELVAQPEKEATEPSAPSAPSVPSVPSAPSVPLAPSAPPAPSAVKKPFRIGTAVIKAPEPVEAAPVEAVEAVEAVAPVEAAVEPVEAAPAAVEAPEAPEQEQHKKDYQTRIKNAMRKLDIHRSKYLLLNTKNPDMKLETYSSKLHQILTRINSSIGSNLVYSQFKTVEGLGVLGISLKANNYYEIELEGSKNNFRFSKRTIQSFMIKDAKRFILYSGEEDMFKRQLILNIFNGKLSSLPVQIRKYVEQYKESRNIDGEICKVIAITGAGAEGISLRNCRTVHIMEPYWNNVRLEQVKGRAIRICSHEDLPYEKRLVNLYTYYTVFSEEQQKKLDQSIMTKDKGITSDQYVYEVSVKKDKINNEFLKLIKESAVDCNINSNENDTVRDNIVCMNIEGSINSYLFDPNLDIDKIKTGMEIKKIVKDEKKEFQDGSQKAKSNLVGDIKTVTIKGVLMKLYPKPGTNGLILNIYPDNDAPNYYTQITLGNVKPIGEFEYNLQYINTATPYKNGIKRFF